MDQPVIFISGLEDTQMRVSSKTMVFLTSDRKTHEFAIELGKFLMPLRFLFPFKKFERPIQGNLRYSKSYGAKGH